MTASLFVAAAGLVLLGVTETDLVSLRGAWQVGGWLALAGGGVALAVRLGRPWLQRRIAAEWPAAAWAGYVVTFALAFLAALGSQLATGVDWSWAALQTALVAALSLALTPGQDQRTADARIGSLGQRDTAGRA